MAVNNSIVDYLSSIGQDSSFGNRKILAGNAGIGNYTGSYDQNVRLLQWARNNDFGAPAQPAAGQPPATPVVGAPANGGAVGTPTMSSANPNTPISVPNLTNTINGADPRSIVTVNSGGGNKLSDYVQQIADKTFSGTKQSIADLKGLQQDQISQEKAVAQQNVDTLKNEVAGQIGSTEIQDAVNSINERFGLNDKIKELTNIQQRIVDAQEALNMGIIYERDRPARMQIITGREASLQRQGLATIGALQGTASVIKGNIELAKAFADQTIGALKDDLERSSKAIYTLLDMENERLVSLSKDEKDLLDSRIKDIQDQQKTIENNKNDVTDLMLKYPYAFSQGGVTLLDSYDTALTKMLPFLAQQDQAKLFKADTFTAFNEKDSDALYNAGFTRQDISDLEAGIQTYGIDATLAALEPTQKIVVQNLLNSQGDLQDVADSQFKSEAVGPNGQLNPGFELSQNAKTGKVFIKKTGKTKSSGGWLKKIFSNI